MSLQKALLVFIALSLQHASAQLENSFNRQLDSLFQVERPSAGYAVGIVTNGNRHPTFYSNQIHRALTLNEKTLFPLGQASEIFLDLLLAWQVQAAILTRETFLEQLLPTGSQVTYDVSGLITLYNLATHTSGFTLKPGMPYLRRLPSETEQPEILRELKMMKVNSFNEYRFSSFNTRLLAYLLRGRGNKVSENLNRNVIEALGLSNTYSDVPSWYDNKVSTKKDSINDVPVYTTLTDMMLLLEAELAPPKGKMGKAIVQTQQTVWKNDDIELALGWRKYKSGTETIFIAQSETCLLMFNKRKGTGLVVLSDDFDSAFATILKELFETNL